MDCPILRVCLLDPFLILVSHYLMSAERYKKKTLVLSDGLNFILAITSPRKIPMQSTTLWTEHGMTSAIYVWHRHHCTYRRRLIGLSGLHRVKWALMICLQRQRLLVRCCVVMAMILSHGQRHLVPLRQESLSLGRLPLVLGSPLIYCMKVMISDSLLVSACSPETWTHPSSNLTDPTQEVA